MQTQPENRRTIRVFVASPADVASERDQLARVISELNLTISALACDKNAVLEFVRWETHCYPALGRTQRVVTEQIGEYDVFVGIMWKRMGTPTGEAESGTEEEFRLAYETWQKHRLPVLFYFCQRPWPADMDLDDLEQVRKVIKFRDELDTKGLIWRYQDHDRFADTIRPHLVLLLGNLLSPRERPAATAERVAERALPAETQAVRDEIAKLAEEAGNVVATMPPGDARTRARLGVVASKMRALSLKGYSLLPELTSGTSSPGERVAAISFLQSIPSAAYLQWLAERLKTEPADVGHQAAVALLEAVRHLHGSHAPELRQAITEAEQGLVDSLGRKEAVWSDRLRVLNEAHQELKQLTGRADGSE